MLESIPVINLMEACQSFKDKNPTLKVGFLKFAELRPKNCVQAEATGTRSVCVCKTYQNFKLMLENAKLSSITNGELLT